MKSLVSRVAALTCLLVGGWGLWAADLQENFDQLYGDQAKRVAAKDSAAFAEKILAGAENLGDDPAMSAFLVQKAVGYWQKNPNNADKTRVGDLLLTDLLTIADRQFADKSYPDALKTYQQASTVAGAIRSNRADDFANRKTISQLRADAIKKIPDLKAQLDDKSKGPAAARALVLLLVLEMDDPKSAAAYLDKLTDQTVRDMAATAAKDPQRIKLDKARELADWYRSEAGGTGADLAAKATSCARAKTYYERFVAEHEKHDMDLLTAQKALTEVSEELDKLSLPAAQDPLTPEDSLGTWLAVLRSSPGTKTYLGFHKDGKLTITAFSPDSGPDRPKNPPLNHVSVTEGSWKIDEKHVTLSNYWTLTLPLGPKMTVDFGHMKTDAQFTKVAKGVPASELAKFTVKGKSTKIPGTWECGQIKVEFHDDGVALLSSSDYGATNITLGKWKLDKGQLVFTGNSWETYVFPYPLGKGETAGKKTVNYGGRYGGMSQDVTIKPADSK